MDEPDYETLARRFLRAEIGIAGDAGHYPATAFLADNSIPYQNVDQFDAEVMLALFRKAVRDEARKLMKALDGE